MPVRIEELRGSGDFSSTSGTILFLVMGAEDQDEAYAEALADPRAPLLIGEFRRDDVAVKDLGGNLFTVDMSYKRGVPSAASETAGTTPGSARPAPPGQDHSAPLSRDVSVTMGGATQHILQAREVRHARGRGDTVPPDFFGLIGFNKKTGEFTGAEIYAATSDFQISRRMFQVTLGYFRHALDLAAHLNSQPYLGCDVQEILFLGLDLNFKDHDEVPWSVTGRFKYAKNKVNVPIDNFDVEVAEIILPEVKGHDYLDIHFEGVQEIYRLEGKDTPVMVERPLYAYALRVYELDSEVSDGASFNDLGLN